MNRKAHNKPGGFSLLEVIAAIFVLALAIPAIAMTFSGSLTVDEDVNDSTQAYFLANMLMNEISERRFWQNASSPGNGPEAGEINGWDRTKFNDIDDYNVFKQTWGTITPPRDESGAALTDYAQFSQYVTVVNVNPPSSDGASRSFTPVSDGSTDFKLVTVTIGWQKGKRSFALTKVFARP